MLLLIVLITVLVSLMVPKPVMFEATTIGAFLAVGFAVFSPSNNSSSIVVVLITAICFGVPIYRLLNRNSK